MNLLHEDLTERIIAAFYIVYNELGYGFLEKVYQNALMIELGKAGLQYKAEHPVKVYYKGLVVGDYRADLIIENQVIVELKAYEAIRLEHEAQLINYLRATSIEVGLLLNFGKKPEFRRRIYSNQRKKLN